MSLRTKKGCVAVPILRVHTPPITCSLRLTRYPLANPFPASFIHPHSSSLPKSTQKLPKTLSTMLEDFHWQSADFRWYYGMESPAHAHCGQALVDAWTQPQSVVIQLLNRCGRGEQAEGRAPTSHNMGMDS